MKRWRGKYTFGRFLWSLVLCGVVIEAVTYLGWIIGQGKLGRLFTDFFHTVQGVPGDAAIGAALGTALVVGGYGPLCGLLRMDFDRLFGWRIGYFIVLAAAEGSLAAGRTHWWGVILLAVLLLVLAFPVLILEALIYDETYS